MKRSYDEILRGQATSNRNAARYEDLYAEHRAHLTAALLESARDQGRVCLLGAGSCLDVDLPALAARFREIHLVDLDAAALAWAVERQPAPVRSRLTRHAPVDLSGVLVALDRWKKSPPTLAQLDAAVEPAIEGLCRTLPAAFDLVASCCVSTQMSRSIASALGQQHAVLADVRRRVTTIHLRTLAALAAPGGQVLFASDLTSNETYPLDELPPGTDLEALVAELVRDGNFFFGADPALLSQILRRDPLLAARAGRARSLRPWLWRAGPERTFLVYAFRFERLPSAP